MSSKMENIKTETWHRIIDDLKTSGYREIYRYEGMDAGTDYSRYDLMNHADDEVIIFEWDNWSEGAVKALRSRLEAIREKYQLSQPVETEE